MNIHIKHINYAYVYIYINRIIDRVARNLIRKLLERDRTRRLGCMAGGVNDVKQHRWFKHILWTDVMERRIQVRKIQF